MKFQAALRRSVKHLGSAAFKKRVLSEDPTMLKNVGILKDINSLGYITNDSQAGRHNKFTSADGKKYDMCEKAYMFGFMQEAKAGEFIKAVSLHTDKLAQVIHYYKDARSDVFPPRDLDLPLTVNKVDESVQTHMSNIVPFSTWDMWRKEVRLDANEKVVYVMCYDLKWNRNASGPGGLFRDVLATLKQIDNPNKRNKTKKKHHPHNAAVIIRFVLPTSTLPEAQALKTVKQSQSNFKTILKRLL